MSLGNRSVVGPFPSSMAALARHRGVALPVEWITLATTVTVMIVADLYGRSFDLLFPESVRTVLVQLTWIAPCLVFRYLAALFEARRRLARRVYVVYFLGLTVLFFGTRIEAALTEAFLQRATGPIIEWAALIDAGLLGVVVIATLAVKARRPEHTRSVLVSQAREALLIGRILAGLILVIAFYSNLKPMIPLINPALHDGAFHAVDRALFLGRDPFEMLAALHAPWLTELMLESYFFFFFIILFGLSGAVLFGTTRDFERIFTAFVIGYVFGLLLYLAWPSLGPAFHAGTWNLLPEATSGSLRANLAMRRAEFLQSPMTSGIHQFDGLAAFPSLHVAHATIFLWYLWRLERVLVLLLTVPYLMLAFSTVYLGWHWVVDIPGGWLVAALAIWATGKVCPSEARRDLVSPR